MFMDSVVVWEERGFWSEEEENVCAGGEQEDKLEGEPFCSRS
jgi:hypothetical protein